MRRRFVAGFALLAILVLLSSGISIIELRRARQTEQGEVRHDQVMHALGVLQAAFTRKSAGFRGYLLFSRPEFLEEAATARQEFLERLGWLQRIVPEAESRRLAARVEKAEADHQAAWERHIGFTGPRSIATDQEFFLGQIAPRGATVVQEIRVLTTFQTRRLEAEHHQAAERLLRTATGVMLGGAAALLLTLVLTGLLARRLTALYKEELRERRKAQDAAQALARQQKELRAIFDGSLDPMVIADDSGRYVDANPAAGELFGISPAELRGRSIAEFVEGDASFEDAWRKFREEGSARGEVRLRRPDGSLREAEFSATADVQPGRHLSALRDVTERKASEAALRESESRKAAILESALDAIITIDAAGQILEFNPAAERVFGYSREEVLGREMADLIIPRGLRERHREGMRRYLAGGEGPVLGRRLEMPAVRKDGSEFPVELSILRLPGEGPPVFTGFVRDITQQRQAEAERLNLLALERKARAAAEAAEAKSAFLVEASNLLAASLDYETTLRQVARLAVPRVADLCIVDILEDGVLKSLAVSHVDQSRVDFVHQIWQRFPRDQQSRAGPAHVARTGRPELTEQISEEMLRSVSRNEEHYQLMRQLRLGSSVCVPLEARGQILGALTFVYEAGGRRYDPEDVPFAESLAQRGALAIDNARLFRQAHEAIRLRDEFLSIASHELKTPITTLLLQVQSLLRRSSVTESADPRLVTVQRQVHRLQNLVDRLLDISRLTAGRLELELEPVDLESVVREVVDRFDEELRRSGCAVTVRAEGPSRGRWDRSRLDQVVTNLMSNAIKYGSGKPIAVILDGNERTARLEVRDHGIGIEPQNLPRIFQRFERAVSERHYGGLGLGLWIVHQIVEALGGSVRATSTPQDGTAFVVELPREPPPGAGSSA